MSTLFLRLQSENRILFCLLVSAVAFTTYSCMYAFRKPIAVGLFSDLAYWGVSLKVLYLIAQILGYALSKFIGIKIVSELKNNNRALGILLLIGVAALALLGFALVPAPWNIVFMFLNGVPLGMVWGFVFSYLEGRRVTEVLAAGLCTSFIVASGVVKSVGSYIMLNWGVSEFWMPFITGCLFIPPLLVSAWLLEKIPPPDTSDIAARCERPPMNARARLALFVRFAPGLTLLVVTYLMLTSLRDLRDNFAADIWLGLGYGQSPEIFTLSELPIALVTLILVGCMMAIKNNRRAFGFNHLLIFLGLFLTGTSTLLMQAAFISPPIWMVCSGLGLYMAYIPFNSVLFDRMIATFSLSANVGFLMYLADSVGYLGSVGVMLYKNTGQPQMDWFVFLQQASLWVAICGCIFTGYAWLYFAGKSRQERKNLLTQTA